jgi:hypothetical protein
MSDAGRNNSRPFGDDEKPERVESCVGDNVVTIIVDEEGDKTIGPAPEHVRKFLQEYRRRHGLPNPLPPAAD